MSRHPVHNILLVAPDRKDQRRLAKALGATGCFVHVVDSIDAAQTRLDTHGADLVVADYEPPGGGISTEDYDRFLEAATRHPARIPGQKVKVLLLADRRDKSELHDLFRLEFLTNLIAKSHPLDLDELIITVGKIVRNDIFGIGKYLCYGVSPRVHPITGSRDKTALIDAMDQYAAGLGIHRRLIGVANGVADELITNAVYNAPRRADGTRPYASQSRSEVVELAPEEQGVFAFACDGRQFVVAVRDPFGSLTAPTVREYLERCFAMGGDQIEVKEGGAGMGLYFIVDALNKVIINIAPERGTEIIGLIDISGSYRDYAEQYKSFHIFVSQ